MPYHSQQKQDSYLDHLVFKQFNGGFFVDVGAHDGIAYNNTLYFEEECNWTGINIEPIPSVYESLMKNRSKCRNYNYAVCDTKGSAEFSVNEGYTEMLSGLKCFQDERHQQRIDKENNIMGGLSKTITVETLPLQSILDIEQVDHINFLSIDVEGAEFSVLRSIDYDRVFIDVVAFEVNYDQAVEKVDKVKFLAEKGYLELTYLGNDIMMIHKDSVFLTDETKILRKYNPL